MRTPLLAGNWKLQPLTRNEARSLATAVAAGARGVTGREIVLAPPSIMLPAVADALAEAEAGSSVQLAGQNLYWEKSGAFTGEISGPMLVDAGCHYVLVGHSERRHLFGETDYTVAKKIGAADACGLCPILCVGETLEQRDAGTTMSVIEKQVRGGLLELTAEGLGRLVIAYEPVWAIGTGRTASPAIAQEVHCAIRAILAEVAPRGIAESLRILYGGSVKPDNIDDLMACADVDGVLVGGASLQANDFLRIVHFQES